MLSNILAIDIYKVSKTGEREGETGKGGLVKRVIAITLCLFHLSMYSWALWSSG